MDKEKWEKTKDRLKEKLNFLKLEEDLEDDEEDLEIEEKTVVPGKDLPEGDLKEKLEWNRRRVMRSRIFFLALAAVVISGFALYNMLHVFRDYVIAETQEIEVASGTNYESIGKKLFRYNSDGVSCITRKNETEWSITYNMQAPIADVCGGTMAVAEQQGNQVYVVNEKGQVGHFETQLPILKVRVSRQGIVAVVLEDEQVTWVNLYHPDGTSIANDKTTVAGIGYPLDVALSPDGQKMMVSYLGIDEGVMTSSVVFYHFGAAGQKKKNNVVSTVEYPETVIPQVYFTDNARAVAVADSGFYVYRGSDEPKQTGEVKFEQEIISSFHDEERIGFLFLNEEEGREYRMELYNYNGKRKEKARLDARFDEIKMENGQILMYNDKGFDVFTRSGRLRFTSAYEKEVEGFFYFGEFRKYLVITKDSFDKIRIS